MKELLTILYEANLIGASTSDPAGLQFHKLCILAHGAPEFKNFDIYNERMGNFYVTILGEKPNFKDIQCCKISMYPISWKCHCREWFLYQFRCLS